MGVSGCGKSSVAQRLAEALGVDWVDADDLHAPEHVAMMKQGLPLSDEQRWPWLDRVGAKLSQSPSDRGLVVACSALKRAYRDRLRGANAEIRFVYLSGDPELIRNRLLARADHFMPASLLESQLRTLEPPASDEPDAITLDIGAPIDELVKRAIAALHGSKGG